jgi:hypothetical protein
VKAFGWANGFAVASDGAATLRYRTAPLRYAFLGLQVLLWLVAGRSLLRMRFGGKKEDEA